MIKMKEIVCPISNERINERLTRVNALITILLVIAGFVFNSVIFPVFLMADFYIRAFTKLSCSPLSLTSRALLNWLRLDPKPTDKAPKIFAARLGFLMTLTITVLFFFDLSLASLIVAGILVFFASLEFVLGICVGCIIYTYMVLPFYK